MITLSTKTGELHDQARCDHQPGDPVAAHPPAAMPQPTMDVYGHPYKDSKDTIADRLDG